DGRVDTAVARAALPADVTHADAVFTAGRAAMLGAALAAGDERLLAQALHDRLHEPYRAPLSPVYERARDVPGALGTTISGSGPTVIVWAPQAACDGCVVELERRLPDARILPLAVTPDGATHP